MNSDTKASLSSNHENAKAELRILHASDLHAGPPFVPEVAESFLKSAHGLIPDAIVISGDLTQRAQREQFVAASEFIDRLPAVPRLLVPGNHDVPLYRVYERFMNPHGLYKELISQELNSVLHLDNAVIVGLDSTAPRTAISNGRIHAWQLKLCEEAFSGVPAGVTKIVVAHHHFAPAPDYLHDWTMPKAKRAMMHFIELGVQLILGGHLHRSFIGNTLDFYPGHHRNRGAIIVQSGTTTSRRGRGRESEKNTFNLIEIYPQSIEISHYLYFQKEQGFSAASRHIFQRS